MTLLDELLLVDLVSGRVLFNGLVHERLVEKAIFFFSTQSFFDILRYLCKHGLINFIVTVATVADNVDDGVLLKLGAVLGGKSAHLDNGFDIVTVDVEDGRLHAQGNVCAVRRGAGRAGIGSKAAVKMCLYCTLCGGEGKKKFAYPIWLLTTMWMTPPVV